MIEVIEAIHTELGILKGRDAIYMDCFRQEYNQIEIIGEINGSLTDVRRNEWIKFLLSFSDVSAFESREIDICNWSCVSSFDKVVESVWLQELGLAKMPNRQHFQVSTYDSMIRLAAGGFRISFGESRQM